MSGRRRKLSILLLCDDDKRHANTLQEHIAAFGRYSAHDIRKFNPRSLRRCRMLDLSGFDVVVIHYSLCIIVDDYLAQDFREKLRRFKGLKIQFIQDDYRWVDRITAMMRYVGIHVLFTLVPAVEIPKIWSEDRLPDVLKINTLAGYVPDIAIDLSGFPLERRPIDVGYRGREVPFWIGRLGQEKVWIAKGVRERAAAYGLRCDIGWTEQDRIYGRAWNQFLTSCRATLGTESGASITDFDGSIEKSVKEYLARHPTAGFEDVHSDILWKFEWNVRMNVISPRMFEAVAARTALVLFPGEYSHVIHPEEHYVLLEKDFSNMDGVVENLRDIERLKAMTERAYRDVVQSDRYSLRRFIEEFDRVVEEYAEPYRGNGERRCQPGQIDKVARIKGRLRAAQIEKLARGQFGGIVGCVGRSGVARLGVLIVKAMISLRIGLGYRETRTLLIRWLTCRRARTSVPPRALLKDVLRLGILRRVRGRMGTGREPFWVSVQFENSGIEFLSHSGASENSQSSGLPRRVGRPRADGTEAHAKVAMQSGRFAMVWNHMALGPNVPYPVTASMVLLFSMGQHGVHEFQALREIAKYEPEAAWAAIAPLLPEEAQRRQV
jgi:hypothetical protein